jgi:hypothetical protein
LCTGGAVTSPTKRLPRPWSEVDLKYGDGDISESSLVSCRSKDDVAGDGPLLSQIHKPKTLFTFGL